MDTKPVFSNIYVGSIEDINDPTFLSLHSISHILSVATEVSDINLSFLNSPSTNEAQNISFKHIPLEDYAHVDFIQHHDEILDFYKSSLSGNILISCYAGISRSTSVFLLILMSFYTQTLSNSWRILKRSRPLARPNLGFMISLCQFEMKKFKLKTTTMDMVSYTAFYVSYLLSAPSFGFELIQDCVVKHYEKKKEVVDGDPTEWVAIQDQVLADFFGFQWTKLVK
ncbi:hypothetical protein RCL1_006157 [Eukaryota sp. TZLM3-RCL]